jgi:hypothetical protein
MGLWKTGSGPARPNIDQRVSDVGPAEKVEKLKYMHRNLVRGVVASPGDSGEHFLFKLAGLILGVRPRWCVLTFWRGKERSSAKSRLRGCRQRLARLPRYAERALQKLRSAG